MSPQATNQQSPLCNPSSAGASGRGEKKGREGRQTLIILIAIILIIVTSGFFADGMVRASLSTNVSNSTGSTKSTPSELLEDDTFLLLLSSVLPNSLNNLLELGKLLLDRPQDWRPLLLVLVLLATSIALAISAPILYAEASPSDPKRSFDSTILSFAANMISILANVVSVFMVGNSKDRTNQDEEHGRQATTINRLNQEIHTLKTKVGDCDRKDERIAEMTTTINDLNDTVKSLNAKVADHDAVVEKKSRKIAFLGRFKRGAPPP